MAVATADQAVKAYVAAMGSTSVQNKYKAGIQAFQGNPMALAAAPQAMQAYQDGVNRSISSGKRAAALNAADPNQWRNNAVTVGAPRLATGAQKASAKMLMSLQKWAPIWQQAHDMVKSMPKGGSANAKARANAVIDLMMATAGTA